MRVVASSSCDHTSWATSIRGVIEIDFLNKFTNILFNNYKNSLLIEYKNLGNYKILNKLYSYISITLKLLIRTTLYNILLI